MTRQNKNARSGQERALRFATDQASCDSPRITLMASRAQQAAEQPAAEEQQIPTTT